MKSSVRKVLSRLAFDITPILSLPFGVLVLGVLLLSLSNCSLLCSFLGANGEGYCGRASEPLPSDPIGPVTPNPVPPRGNVYFWVQPGYRCQTSTGEMVESYRDAIRLNSDGSFTVLGDKCTQSSGVSGSTTDLEIEGDLIGYGKGIYQKAK